MKIEVSAPGKLVLIGEYGVLFGAPAVVMAVNRRARVELTPAEGARWILTAPELAPRPVELDVSRRTVGRDGCLRAPREGNAVKRARNDRPVSSAIHRP